jgi:hypothetical protein
VVLYCFKPSSMLPVLLPGNMQLVIYCSYRAENNVLNMDLLVLSVENFPELFLGAFAELRKATISLIFMDPCIVDDSVEVPTR